MGNTELSVAFLAQAPSQFCILLAQVGSCPGSRDGFAVMVVVSESRHPKSLSFAGWGKQHLGKFAAP